MSQPIRSVLVGFCEHNRVIKYCQKEELLSAVKTAFSDVLQVENIPHICLQVKDNEWGGAFVDVLTQDDIPDRSALRIIITNHSTGTQLVSNLSEVG